MKKFLLQVICLLLAFVSMLRAAAPSSPLDPGKLLKTIRVACVGDSITQGVGAENGKSYPSQLQELLGDDWEVGNFGVSARTLLRKGDFPYWKENAFRQAQDFQPDAVIIMLGTNDTKPQNWTHKDEFAADYTDLIQTFLALPTHPRVFVCRPVPVPEPGNFGINETNIQEEIKMLDRIIEAQPATLIDMHAALADHPELFPDRVHPNTTGAGLMAQAAFEALTGKKPEPPLAIRTNSLFRSHAVLQRGIDHPVWGTAPDGTDVTVEFAGQKISTVARDGRWKVNLRPLAVSDQPREMIVSSPAGKIVLRDILVGDVWLASGQSNMERQLGPRPPQQELTGWKEEVASANYPLIRQFYVPQKMAAGAVSDVNGRWAVCTPETASQFTAVGYYFARDVFKAIHVPIGILHSSWGGTPAEAWTSPEALKNLPEFKEMMEAMDATQSGRPPKDVRGEWLAKNDPGSTPGHGWEMAEFTPSDWQAAELPATLDHMGQANFHGVIWFRREFDLPAEAEGKPALLHLGKLDDEDTTWINGQRVGATNSWQNNRDYAIPAGAMHSGKNVITVRLVNVAGNGGWLVAPNELKLDFTGTALPPVMLSGQWNYRTSTSFTNGPAWVMTSGGPGQYQPGNLFRSMLAPLIPYPIRGVVWYQGEANSARASIYRRLFPAMINDWRQRWNIGPFLFLYVQIAPHKDMSPEIREAQFLTLKQLPNLAMAVITDHGDANDIHPSQKEPVGQRLAMAARALEYGEKIEYSGPLYESVAFAGNKATIQFSHLGSGLMAQDGPLKGFTISGADKNFIPAQAEIQGDSVLVWSDAVVAPAAVRYGWSNVPDVNFFNKEGLPASPFRTDPD
ncbi:MAG: GDSL-type esterase/lipase family protein [Chthoniobacterales bacterium]